MSYMRGEFYIFQTSAGVAEEVGGWVPTGGDPEQEDAHMQFYCPNLTGTLPMSVLDELVVMRYAELVADGLLDGVAQRVLATHEGNFGMDALAKQQGLPTVMDFLEQFMKKHEKGQPKIAPFDIDEDM